MIEENELKINVVLVLDSERLDKMPQYFGKNFLLCEGLIYTYMEKLCSSYPGGYWNFYETSNEGFFIAPSNSVNLLNLVWENNYFEGVMGQEAAGIVACLFAYNHMASINEGDMFADLYQLLLEYSWCHSEGSIIAKAID